MNASAAGQPASGTSAESYDGLAALGFDPSVPSPARMYDYYLGGKDNFPADREAAEQALSVVPFGREVALANRQFLARAVTFMARSGIDQFVDLGTGIPTRPNVHEVARNIRPVPACYTSITTRWSAPMPEPCWRRMTESRRSMVMSAPRRPS